MTRWIDRLLGIGEAEPSVQLVSEKPQEPRIIGKLEIHLIPQVGCKLTGEFKSTQRDVTQADYYNILDRIRSRQEPLSFHVSDQEFVIIPAELLRNCIVSIKLIRPEETESAAVSAEGVGQ